MEEKKDVAAKAPASPTLGKRGRSLGVIIFLAAIGSIIGFLIYQTVSTGRAALSVESEPTALVYVDGEQKGKTPLELEMEAREVTVKLVPDSTTPLPPYESKVKLVDGVKTIVRRKFGENEGEATGQIISFRKDSGASANVAVVSDPDGVEVSIDGEIAGVTPLKVASGAGKHSVELTANNYETLNFDINAVSGYTVTASVTLAKKPKVEEPTQTDGSNQTKEATESATKSVNMVKILKTSVGFLRVRADASVNSEEIGQAKPDETYGELDYNKENNWYKIDFNGKDGWVFGDYVEEVKQDK